MQLQGKKHHIKDKICISSPHLAGGEIKYIEDAFSKNWVTTMGENIDEFENDLQKILGNSAFVCALNSATSAIHLSLIMLDVKPGDEVVTSSFSFCASANPIKYLQATPVFVDSELETWNMCPVALEEAILDRIAHHKKPKAIIVVHLYGMPAKMKEISEIAKKYEIPLIEDAAEALGSKYQGNSCGTFGDFSVLSFNGNKIITTSGGGALVCRNPEDKQKAIFLSTQARDDAPHYQHSQVGYNYRMSNISAGIGRGQMEVLVDRVAKRRAINKKYQEIFADKAGIRVFVEPNEHFFSNHWLTAITITPEICGFSREDLRLRMLEENIESRPLWKPMHMQPVFADAPYYGGHVAENLFELGLCLPSGSNLTHSEFQRISKVIHSFL